MTTSRLGFDIHGPADGPVLVLGSSLGTTRTMWDPQVPMLSDTFRVVRYDHVGHGESDVPPGPYAIEELAAEVLALLDTLGIERAHFAGVSLGGMVALQIAATRPERVDRLAVVCSSAHVPPAQGWLDRAATVRSSGMPAVSDAVAARWFTPAFADSAPAKALREELTRVPPEGYAGCCEAIAAMDLRPLLPRIEAATLVVAGAADPATPVEHAEVIVEGIGRNDTCVRLEVVDAAAHLSNVERPAEVGRLLMAHLSGRETR